MTTPSGQATHPVAAERVLFDAEASWCRIVATLRPRLPAEPPKRNQVLDLWEVEQFGRDSFDDPDYLSIYGMKASEWYARGVRLLGRTTLEAVRDRPGDRRRYRASRAGDA
jgi:hypothetical protein